jgi:alpha-tubulin suppressor-like RCC1 family protein
MNNSNLKELNNTPLIIQMLIEKTNYISKYGYDNDIKKRDFIELCKSIRNTGGTELWTKQCAKILGQIIKLINKFNLLKDLVHAEINQDIIGLIQVKSCINTKIHFNQITQKVRKIKLGGYHCAFLTEDNNFYTMGSNGFGQIGNHSNESCYESPFLHHQFDRVTDFCCGYSFTAVINNEKLYTCGAGDNGRLGLGDTEDYNYMKHVETNFVPKSVEGGSTIMLILSVDDKLYTCGQRKYSGHYNQETNILIPTLLKFSENNRISKIEVGIGGYHAIVLTKSNKVYTWGHNRVGQLGLGFLGGNNDEGDESDEEESDDNVIRKPTLVTSVANLRIKDIKAGWGHSIILTFDNRVYMCGRNVENQLGITKNACKLNYSNMHCIDKFTFIDYYNIKSVSAGGTFTILKNVDNKITILGDNMKNFDTSSEFNKILCSGTDLFLHI